MNYDEARPGGLLRIPPQTSTLRQHYAGLAMQAFITAAWSNPRAALKDYEEWRQPLDVGADGAFDVWVAVKAFEYADAMLIAEAKLPPPTLEAAPEDPQP